MYILQRANKSHQFYKGTIVVLENPTKSEYISVQQNESDGKIENRAEKVFDESNKSISFRDFCKLNYTPDQFDESIIQ